MDSRFSPGLLAAGLLGLFMSTASLRAEVDARPLKPEIERLGEHEFQVGLVRFDAEKREITIPTTLNMDENLMEFVLVMTHGKLHESLLVTEANPFHINIAFKLLGVPARPDYFPELDKNFKPLPHEALKEEAMKPSLVSARLSWQQDGELKSLPLERLVRHSKLERGIEKGRWIYTGSLIDYGKYVPTLTGDIFAIYNTRSAMINYVGADKNNDLVWFPVSDLLPPIGTQVEFTIELGEKVGAKKP